MTTVLHETLDYPLYLSIAFGITFLVGSLIMWFLVRPRAQAVAVDHEHHPGLIEQLKDTQPFPESAAGFVDSHSSLVRAVAGEPRAYMLFRFVLRGIFGVLILSAITRTSPAEALIIISTVSMWLLSRDWIQHVHEENVEVRVENAVFRERMNVADIDTHIEHEPEESAEGGTPSLPLEPPDE